MADNCNGSINDNTPLPPYVPQELCVGTWQINSLTPDICELNDRKRQETYIAEVLNISGAPIYIYKLLGVHEQGKGSLLSESTIFATSAYPGFPLTGVNSGGSWRSSFEGSGVPGSSWIGASFGPKLHNGQPAYAPNKPKMLDVGAVTLTQSTDPNRWAKQVRLDISDGTCKASEPLYSGVGNGTLSIRSVGVNAVQCNVTLIATSSSEFEVFVSGIPGTFGFAAVNEAFNSTALNFTVIAGSTPYSVGDMFTIAIDYKWERAGIFNLVQSPLPQTLGLKSVLLANAVRVVPTMFTGTGSWEVLQFDVRDSAPTDINNIQDLFFNENRDRDYADAPIVLRVQFNPADSTSDLSRFGINILDQYSFTVSFNSMVTMLGRPVVVGDIIDVIPEMQYDHNLNPVKKFLEVTDTGWASEGFGPQWQPMLYRFQAQQALPSQETRDIFGTVNTQKYLLSDDLLQFNNQLDTTPLTQTEEVIKAAADAVPEIGTDDQIVTVGQPLKIPLPPVNEFGQPEPIQQKPVPDGRQGIYIEDGLPSNGEPYGEGYKLPETAGVSDGDYFRLYYAPETKIPPRLYRFSAVKNRWIFMETDRRGDYSSHRPSVRNILQSETKQGLRKKL